MKQYTFYTSKTRRIKKLRMITFVLFLLHITYISISLYLLFKESSSIDKLSSDLIVYLAPQIDVILFFAVFPFITNSIFIYALYISGDCSNISFGTFLYLVVFLITLNFGSVTLVFNNLEFGYITENTIVIKNVYKDINVYKASDIDYVDIDLRYKGVVDNYFIDYDIRFVDNKYIELSSFDSCTYEKLMIVNKILEKKGVSIHRDVLSEKTKVKVIKWCSKYPETLKPFKHLLAIS